MPYKIYVQGPSLKIMQWAKTKKDLEASFFDCPKVTEADKHKIAMSFKRYAINGLPKNNKQKYRHVKHNIFELKPTSQLRLLGFEGDKSFIVLFCIRKKDNKLNKNDIDKAQELWRLHNEEKK